MKVKIKVEDLNREKMQRLTDTVVNVRTNPKSRRRKRKGHEKIKLSSPVLINKKMTDQQQYLIGTVSGKPHSLGGGTEIIIFT